MLKYSNPGDAPATSSGQAKTDPAAGSWEEGKGGGSTEAEGGGDEPGGFGARSARSFYGFDKDAAAKRNASKPGKKKDGSTNIEVELVRSDTTTGWGIGIGENANGSHTITTVIGGPAEGKLVPRDLILMVDGNAADTFDHEDLMELFRAAATVTIKLTIKRPSPRLPQESESEDSGEDDDFGFGDAAEGDEYGYE